MDKSESIKSIAIAMCSVQSSMEAASKASDNPFFNSKYADLSEVLRCIKSVLPNNDLSFMQMPSFECGVVSVETIVMHKTGEWISSVSSSPISKSNPQGVGDAITYLRRYSLAAIFGLAQKDDDGNSNSETPQKKENKSKSPDTPINWYQESQFNQEKENISTAIRGGMPPSEVIKNLQDQGFAINKKIRAEIESI